MNPHREDLAMTSHQPESPRFTLNPRSGLAVTALGIVLLAALLLQ